MQQFQVPQFIEIEDKIFGFITMRQFFILLIPVGFGILFYFISTIGLTIILTTPVLIVSSIFAFLKPNGMKFSRFILSFVSFTFKPRLYVWKRQENTKSFQPLKEESKSKKEKSIGLKNKKGELETGSKVSEEDLIKTGNESEFLDELLNQ